MVVALAVGMEALMAVEMAGGVATVVGSVVGWAGSR